MYRLAAAMVLALVIGLNGFEGAQLQTKTKKRECTVECTTGHDGKSTNCQRICRDRWVQRDRKERCVWECVMEPRKPLYCRWVCERET
jgi:hypothetical protein